MPGCLSLSDLLARRGAVRINRGSPLARSLRTALLANATPVSDVVDLIGSCRTSSVVTVSDRPGSMGRSWFRAAEGSASSTKLALTADSLPAGDTGFSVFLWAEVGSGGVVSYLYSRLAASGATTIAASGGSTDFVFRSTEGFAMSVSAASVQDGRLHLLGLTVTKGGVLRAYVDGEEVGTSTDSAVHNVPASTGMDLLFHSFECPRTNLYAINQWNRTLTPGEIRALWRPQTRFDLYERPRRSSVKAPSGSTTTVTGSGGIVFAGAGSAAIEIVRAGTGGAVFSGAATPNIDRAVQGEGGAAFSGTATSNIDLASTGTGNIAYGGAVSGVINIGAQGAGSVVFGGIAPVGGSLAVVGSGTITFSGAAPISIEGERISFPGVVLLTSEQSIEVVVAERRLFVSEPSIELGYARPS